MSSKIEEIVKKDFYLLGEATKLLGVCRMTMWKWVNSGKIKTYKIGREVLIEKKTVEDLK